MNTSGLTDSDLLRQSAIGRDAALSTLFDRHAAAVTRYVWALVSTRMDVEEVVQDTFVTLWQRAGSISVVQESVLPWLLVTGRNHALNLRRKRARDRNVDVSDELPVADAVGEEARDRLRWVIEEIERLGPVDRRICELCLIDGRSYADAAESVGISVGAVKQRVSRSRSRLRKAVSEHEN